MVISKTVAFRGISDCKIAAITADTPTGLTYGSLVDVPIATLTLTEVRDNHELKHDDRVQDIDSVLQSADISGTIARVPLEILEILTGGSITASGTGANEKQTFDLDSTDNSGYFKLEVVSARAHADAGDVGDIHIQYKKCKVFGDLQYNLEEGYATISFTAKAIKTIYDNEIKNIVFNKTAAAIS